MSRHLLKTNQIALGLIPTMLWGEENSTLGNVNQRATTHQQTNSDIRFRSLSCQINCSKSSASDIKPFEIQPGSRQKVTISNLKIRVNSRLIQCPTLVQLNNMTSIGLRYTKKQYVHHHTVSSHLNNVQVSKQCLVLK